MTAAGDKAMRILTRLGLGLLPALLFGLYARAPRLVFIPFLVLVPWILLYTDDRVRRVSPGWYVFGAWVSWVALHPAIQRIGGWYAPLVMGSVLFVMWIPFAPLLRAIHHRLHLPRTLTVAIVWAAVEWGRATFTVSHFELFSLGYAVARYPILTQIADATGVYGVSFLIAAVNGLLADAYYAMRDASWSWRALTTRRLVLSAACVAAGFVATAGYGVYRLATAVWIEGPRVAIVQPNGTHRRGTALGDHLDLLLLTDRLVPPGSVDVIVWPENAIFDNIRREGVYLDDLRWLGSRKGAPMIVGGMTWPEFNPARRFNSAFLVDQDGRIVAEYVKQALFPWTESVPFDRTLEKVWPAAQRFHRRLIRASWGAVARAMPGRESTLLPLPWKGGTLPVFAPICNENGYAAIPAQAARRGARMLVNITSEADLGGAIQEQLLRICMLRAIETRMPYVRAGNTGVSAIIDPQGRVRRVLIGERGRRISDKGVLIDRVPLSPEGTSPYAASRDAFALACVAATLALLVLGWVRPRPARIATVAVLVSIVGLSACGGVPVPGDDPSAAKPALERGQALLAEGRAPAALVEFGVACGDPDVCRLVLPAAAEAFNKARAVEDAADFFSLVRDRHPSLAPEALGFRGYFREQLALLDEAEADYSASIAAQPTSHVLGFLASLRLLRGDPAGAVEAARRAVALEPSDLEGKTLLGRALRLDDRAVEAESVLMEVVRERPDFAKAWGELGWALWVQGNEAGAKGAFARHAQLDATTTESRFMLARIALRGGDPSEATRLLREMEAIQKANLPRLRAEE